MGVEKEMVGMIRGCIKTVTCGKKLCRNGKYSLSNDSTKQAPIYTKLAYILGLRVSPSHRKMGIGLKLVNTMEDWFRENGAEYSYIATENDNTASVKLFTHKCAYSKFRTPSILVNPVFEHRVAISRRVAILKLDPSDAEALYRRRFSTTEFFPRDIDSVLNNKLSLGTFLSVLRGALDFASWVGSDWFLENPPASWAVLSVWNCKEVFKLEVRGASRMRRTFAKTTRVLDRVFPWLGLPSVPEVFRPFGFHFLYGLGGEGQEAVRMVKALCGHSHNLARERGCGVVATEVASGGNQLLMLAEDLGKRFLPAFNTPTGLPYAWVNLKYGVMEGETTETSTSGCGSLILEMGALSQLTGDSRFESAALRALRKLWSLRSSLNLFGTTLDVVTGEWIEFSSGIGAGLDSFYEYLFKAHVLFGKEEFWRMFHSAYLAVQKYFRHGSWYHEADMRTGKATYWQLTSLQAFWPGLQVLLGDIPAANSSHREFFHVWEKFGVLPERYLLDRQMLHPTEKYYPLRPELAESTFYLYQATKDPWYLAVGESIINSLNLYTKVEGGFASVRDVTTMQLEDHQHSFFLSETCKYLYLLFDDSFLADQNYVFTTEGHPLPVLHAWHERLSETVKSLEDTPAQCLFKFVRPCLSSQVDKMGSRLRALATFPMLELTIGAPLTKNVESIPPLAGRDYVVHLDIVGYG